MAEEQKRATHVQQAYNELDNAVAHGNEDAVTAARKRLDAAGQDGDAIVAEARARFADESDPETKRRAAAQRRAAMQAEVNAESARSTPPQGRTTKAEAKQATAERKPGAQT